MGDFLVNLLLFAAGQLAAWYYLRTGRVVVGFVATALLWLLLDGWLVSRYVFRVDGPPWSWLLVAFHATAVAVVAMLLLGLWRKRWSATARNRPSLFAAALELHLCGDYAAAARAFRRLVRNDPWDAAARLGLGNAERRLGRLDAARRAYRSALRVDIEGRYRELARMQIDRVRRPRRTAT